MSLFLCPEGIYWTEFASYSCLKGCTVIHSPHLWLWIKTVRNSWNVVVWIIVFAILCQRGSSVGGCYVPVPFPPNWKKKRKEKVPFANKLRQIPVLLSLFIYSCCSVPTNCRSFVNFCIFPPHHTLISHLTITTFHLGHLLFVEPFTFKCIHFLSPNLILSFKHFCLKRECDDL